MHLFQQSIFFFQEMARLNEKTGKKGKKRDHGDDTEESLGVRNRINKKKKFKK